MKTEINPQESKRAFAFDLWKKAAMPKVTLFKTLNVSRVIKVGKRSGMKTNMLMCWCIGQAASGIEEFYTLPVGEHLWKFDRLAVNTVVLQRTGLPDFVIFRFLMIFSSLTPITCDLPSKFTTQARTICWAMNIW